MASYSKIPVALLALAVDLVIAYNCSWRTSGMSGHWQQAYVSHHIMQANIWFVLALCKHFSRSRCPAWSCLSRSCLWLVEITILVPFNSGPSSIVIFCEKPNIVVLQLAILLFCLAFQLVQCASVNIHHHSLLWLCEAAQFSLLLLAAYW